MPQKQTLLTFNTQYLNATDIDHFYNIEESFYSKLQYVKCIYKPQVYSCSLDSFYLKTMGVTIA